MPQFTAANAAENGRRGQEARRQRKLAASVPALPAVDSEETARTNRVMKQIERCDEFLSDCNRDDFVKLTAAKERLWNLIYPRAGVLKPRSSKGRDHAPSVTAAPQASEPATPQNTTS